MGCHMKNKLALKKVTLRDLEEVSLAKVVGASGQYSCPDGTCFDCTNFQCENTWQCYTAAATSCQYTCQAEYTCDYTCGGCSNGCTPGCGN
jgi:hypothetical protein